MTLPDSLTCRAASLDDAPMLAQAAAAMFVSAFAADNTPEDMQAYLQKAFGAKIQSRQILDPANDTLLLFGGEQLLGYAQIDYGPGPESLSLTRPGGIQRFYLDQRAHGTGAANILLEAVLTAARERSVLCLWLSVWEHNARAIAYYRKAGFEVMGDTHFWLGEDKQRDLLMVRQAG